MALPIAQQCFQEGFQRRSEQLIKAALNPRAATTYPGAGTAKMIMQGKGLELDIKNPATGSFTRLLKQWQAPGDELRSLNENKQKFVQDMLGLKREYASAMARGNLGRADVLSATMQEMKGRFLRDRESLYGALGAGAEKRRKLVETGVPALAGGAAVGGLGAGGLYLRDHLANQNRQSEMSNAPFMDRLKYFVAPKATISKRLFDF